jgi:hypothetical protein
MSVSYKTKWQEANDNLSTLAAENDRLRSDVAMMKAEIIRLNALLDGDSKARQLRAQQQAEQIVDLAGIARHMRVERTTPQQWRQRKLLPPVDYPEIAEPLWRVTTLLDQFVRPTRRIWYDDPEGLSPAA